MTQLRDTRRTASLKPADFDALLVIGGKGAMFDLPLDTALARFAGALHDRGGVVAAVCHGPAGLLRARTGDGRLLLAGRAVTGFTNEEETVFGKTWRAKYPFLLEDEARRVGARWEEAPLMMPHVTVDGRLVTGQNPFGTSVATEAVVRALGKTPVARPRWKDEAAVYAAVELLALDTVVAKRELATQAKTLQVDLIGLLGYYQLQTASTTADVQRAVLLMELAAPYMPAPEISLGLATGYQRLGRTHDARALATDVAARHKTHEREARALLASLPQ
jgi:putative intracellular protease/amidase